MPEQEVRELPGIAEVEPGLGEHARAVLERRPVARHGDDRANLELLLAQVADLPDDRLGAVFVCSAALVTPGGREAVAEGRMPGRLVREPRGANGFGYDPIFVPDGMHHTSAELDADTKDGISHRGRALRALVPAIVAAVRG